MVQKAHAFVQFSALSQALLCFEDQEQIYLHNKRIYISYSGREAIQEDHSQTSI